MHSLYIDTTERRRKPWLFFSWVPQSVYAIFRLRSVRKLSFVDCKPVLRQFSQQPFCARLYILKAPLVAVVHERINQRGWAFDSALCMPWQFPFEKQPRGIAGYYECSGLVPVVGQPCANITHRRGRCWIQCGRSWGETDTQCYTVEHTGEKEPTHHWLSWSSKV